ncbi:MAG: peptide chain release factor 2 [Patescibacteria group bacterium]|nr:peptide chain release factor 2 [Patescibacteria group bacterium]
MNELKTQIKKLSERLEKALSVLKLEEERIQLSDLEKTSSAADFWNDQSVAQETMKKISAIRAHLDKWDGLTKEINDLAELIENTSDNDHSLIKELETNLTDITERFEKTEFELLFSGEYDANNAILSISAGSGGTDAQDWAEMLLRMYLKFAEKQAFETEIIEQTRGEEAGVKSATVKIEGFFAYGYLKSEFGVHRLVRLSPYDADNARHTSFALVEVLPEIEKEEFVLDEKDLRIDVFRSGGHGGQSVNTTDSAVRITHLPTGLTAVSQNERSQLQNKEGALKVLKSKLTLLAKQKNVAELSELKGEPISAEWGSQIRSYVLHPYTLVKDGRTQYETADTQAVLDGKIDEFIEAYLRKEISEPKKA